MVKVAQKSTTGVFLSIMKHSSKVRNSIGICTRVKVKCSQKLNYMSRIIVLKI